MYEKPATGGGPLDDCSLGWSNEEVVAESRRLFAEHGTDDAVIDFFVEDARDMDRQQPDVPHFFFGTCLKLLRPAVTIRCIEVQALADAAERVQQQLLARLRLSPHPARDAREWEFQA